MKTIKEIEQEINELAEFVRQNPNKAKRAKAKVSQLRQYIRYLEYDPSEEFILNDKKLLSGRVKSLESKYPQWLESGDRSSLKNPQSTYRTSVGINKIKRQITAYNYLLK
jgi:hypothetical protein